MSLEEFHLRAVEPIAIRLDDDGDVPNSPLPLLYYPAVVDPDRVNPTLWEQLFAANDWPDCWRNGVFSFPHYHSNAHEVLGCCSGHADVRLGGMNGHVQRIQAGDAVVLPAGVGHENLGAAADFTVVGSYPRGQSPDLCRGGARPPNVARTIQAVPLPARDPVFGRDGALRKMWSLK